MNKRKIIKAGQRYKGRQITRKSISTERARRAAGSLLVSALWLCVSLARAQTLTQITDTLRNADGTLANGRMLLVWDAFTQTGGVAIAGGTKSYTITNGVIDLQLAYNSADGYTPFNTAYRVDYYLTGNAIYHELWVVPPGGPFALKDIVIGRSPGPPLTPLSKLLPQNGGLGDLTPDQGVGLCVYAVTNTSWGLTPCGSGGGGGISTLNGLTGASQTFASGTSGNNFNIVSSGSVHTFNLPTASSVNRGLLSSADWNTFNSKQAALSSANSPSHEFFNSFTAPNTFGSAQPSFADIAGVVAASQLPTPGATTLGGVEAKDCTGAGHVLKIGTDGTVTCSADAGGGGGGLSDPGTNGVVFRSSAGTTRVSAAEDFSGPAYCAPSTASGSAYACSLSPAISSYVAGTKYRFKADVANTGAATINFNSLGAKTIKKVSGGVTTDISANDILAGMMVDLVYDGTNMQMAGSLQKSDVAALPLGPCAAHQFETGIDSGGNITCAQPGFSDISGTVAATQLPAPGATTLGGVESKDCTGTGHVLKINTDGTVTCSADAGGGGGGSLNTANYLLDSSGQGSAVNLTSGSDTTIASVNLPGGAIGAGECVKAEMEIQEPTSGAGGTIDYKFWYGSGSIDLMNISSLINYELFAEVEFCNNSASQGGTASTVAQTVSIPRSFFWDSTPNGTHTTAYVGTDGLWKTWTVDSTTAQTIKVTGNASATGQTVHLRHWAVTVEKNKS